ncbi:MAG: hypothetical protein HY067_18475 [Betaproteobacteria bacterium]|nr:hypothetical protein [Betaproteobacteria bacterium]
MKRKSAEEKHGNGGLYASVLIPPLLCDPSFFFAPFAANAFDSFLNPRGATVHG